MLEPTHELASLLHKNYSSCPDMPTQLITGPVRQNRNVSYPVYVLFRTHLAGPKSFNVRARECHNNARGEHNARGEVECVISPRALLWYSVTKSIIVAFECT